MFNLYWLLIFVILISHDLQKRVVSKDEEKQRILEDTKELTEKTEKMAEEMEQKNKELKNVEKYVILFPNY